MEDDSLNICLSSPISSKNELGCSLENKFRLLYSHSWHPVWVKCSLVFKT